MKTELIEKLEKLPVSLEKEVEDFVDFLIYKDQQKQEVREPSSLKYNNSMIKSLESDVVKESEVEKPKLKRVAGLLKGKIWMSDDFDEPLEEFKDYR